VVNVAEWGESDGPRGGARCLCGSGWFWAGVGAGGEDGWWSEKRGGVVVSGVLVVVVGRGLRLGLGYLPLISTV
jgi:hypothetical protein